jgi:hypothetical protein
MAGRAAAAIADELAPRARQTDENEGQQKIGEDPQAYGYAAGFGITKPCEDEVVSQPVELRRRAADLASRSLLLRIR